MTLGPEREAREESGDHAQIAAATLQLVGELGADRITTADVARHLGISHAAMLRRCPTEADLWQIAAAFIARQMLDSFNASLRDGPSQIERLRSIVAAPVQLVVDTPALRDILFSRRLRQNYAALTRELSAVRLQFERLLAQVVAQGIAAGDFADGLDPGEAASRIVEMLQGILLRWSVAFEPDIALEDVWARIDGLLDRSAGAAPTSGESPVSPRGGR